MKEPQRLPPGHSHAQGLPRRGAISNGLWDVMGAVPGLKVPALPPCGAHSLVTHYGTFPRLRGPHLCAGRGRLQEKNKELKDCCPGHQVVTIPRRGGTRLCTPRPGKILGFCPGSPTVQRGTLGSPWASAALLKAPGCKRPWIPQSLLQLPHQGLCHWLLCLSQSNKQQPSSMV